MTTYECNKCGMSVKANCGKCDIPLENSFLSLDDGSEVQISQCPSCEGKIKSPQCCGTDMSCSL
jgi:hypothetical protein